MKQQWCIEQHTKTNHFYDTYLPYEFHLRMVYNVYQDFKHLLDNESDYYGKGYDIVTLRNACGIAVYGHDLIEDCRVSYNDCKTNLGQEASDIIYAVSNEKGKTRSERANSKYYEGIVKTPGAVFVKLCDRIANVQYSKMPKSRMFDTYSKENTAFLEGLGLIFQDNELQPMVDYLLNLFN